MYLHFVMQKVRNENKFEMLISYFISLTKKLYKKRKDKTVLGQWHLLAPSGILQFGTFLELHLEQLPSETGLAVFLQGELKNS
jgi:hypothetical protein